MDCRKLPLARGWLRYSLSSWAALPWDTQESFSHSCSVAVTEPSGVFLHNTQWDDTEQYCWKRTALCPSHSGKPLSVLTSPWVPLLIKLPWAKSSQFCLLKQQKVKPTKKKPSFLPFWWLKPSPNMGGGPESMRPSTGNGRKEGKNPPSFSSSHKQLSKGWNSHRDHTTVFPLFSSLLSWLEESGTPIKPGHLHLHLPLPGGHSTACLSPGTACPRSRAAEKKPVPWSCPTALLGLCKHGAWEKSFICETSCISWLPNASSSCQVFFISLLCNSRSLDNPGFMHGSPWLTQCLSVYTVRRKALFSEAHLSNTDFVRAPNGGGRATEPRSGPRAMGISCSCTSNFAKKRTQLQLTLGYSTESLREKY